MDFNFDIKHTANMKAVRTADFPLFRFSKALRNICLFLFIVSVLFFLVSFFGITSGYATLKMSVLWLALYLIFWQVQLFVDLKIKKPQHSITIADAVADASKYNLAELLDFDLSRVTYASVKFCEKKNIPINATALFYFSVKAGKDITIIAARLGIDIKKIESNIKNYLEKIPRSERGVNFSEDFQATIQEAIIIANERGHTLIEEKDILVGLARHSELFKTILVEYDLKDKDVENITLWLDGIESFIKKNNKFWTYENLMRKGSLGKNWSSGYTLTLDEFSIDWTQSVSTWVSREIIGHEKEIHETEMILARDKLSNVLIIGDAGTGRKSIVEALAQKCFLSMSLPELNNKRVVELDIVSLTARIQDFEKLETILDQIFNEVLASGNVILVIDELQNFVGHTVQKAGVVDISGILAKYLPIENFKFIGITSYDGLHKNIEQNASFVDFFRKVEVKEISEPETIQILQQAALDLEAKYHILILYPSIREIVNLTGRYMPSLPFPKKALDILDEAAIYVQSHHEHIVLPHHISEIISDKTEIPVGKMELKEKETLLNLENLIHQRLVNQEEAVKEISIAMRRARSGISSKNRPMGSFLFFGPTGVGKTETAKALAQIYFGSEEKMIRLDMSEFQAITDIPRLLGAVSPVEIQGLLTTPVRENPFSLVLVDEIEKSHPNILNLFLQVLDEGHITDGQGRKVVFTNTIIICTSNAGADDIFKQVESGQPIDKQKLVDSLIAKGMFKPEFVNRFDATVAFHPLTKENLMQIAQLSLASLQKNLKEKEIDFIITEELKEKVVELSYKPEFGAREMRRVIQDKIENVIAEALLSDKIKKTDHFTVNSENFELVINQSK